MQTCAGTLVMSQQQGLTRRGANWRRLQRCRRLWSEQPAASSAGLHPGSSPTPHRDPRSCAPLRRISYAGSWQQLHTLFECVQATMDLCREWPMLWCTS